MIKLLKPFLAIANALVTHLLRSRLHWLLSGNVVLLEVTGRRSGRVFFVPVNYSLITGGISVMGYRSRQWWRNIETGHQLPVYLRGQRTITNPEVITDDLEAMVAALVGRGWMRKTAARASARDSVLIQLRFPETNEADSHE